MKANSRRRVLISSMAMLLVALVALSTATFAWFTTSSSATADGINASTTKSSKLLVAKKDLDFKDSISYGFDDVLRPATSTDGSNWYKNTADAIDNYASTSEFSPVSNTELENYVYVEMLNIKNEGDTAINDVEITVTTGTLSSFARVAIVPCDAQTVANTMPAVTAANFKANIYGLAKDRTWEPMNGDTSVTTDDFKTVGAANGAVIDAENFAAGAVKSYKIFVWFEGQDADCFDTTNATLVAPTISFSVAGSAVQ